MPAKKITRKLISAKLPLKEAAAPVAAAVEVVEQPQEQEDEGGYGKREVRSKKVCLFCQSKSDPSYTDLIVLRRFISDRVRILPKAKSGVCSRHQRAVAKNIKYARHLSLLPFVPKV